MRKYSDKIFTWLIRLFHEVFGLSPNQVSILSLAAGIVAAAVTALGFVFDGMLLMALSQVIDALDGGIARQYNLQSAAGAKLELYFDRTCEAAMFAALVAIGKTDVLTTVLAFVAIILVTIATNARTGASALADGNERSEHRLHRNTILISRRRLTVNCSSVRFPH